MMHGQPGMVGNNGFMGKQCMIRNQEMIKKSGVYGTKD